MKCWRLPFRLPVFILCPTCCAQEKERCEYQRASKRSAVEKAARLQAEVDRLSSQAADAVDALEAQRSAAAAMPPADSGATPPTAAAGEIAALNQKLEETLEMAAAATEMAEMEAAERKKLSSALQESASREKELRLLAENAISAATSSAKAKAADESEAASAAAATAAAREERRVAVQRAETLEEELMELKTAAEEQVRSPKLTVAFSQVILHINAVPCCWTQRKDAVTKLASAEEQREALAGKLTEAAARAEAAEQRAADLDASLATCSASDSAALGAVRSELSDRCHAVTKLERELKEAMAAHDSAAVENRVLSQSLEACQAELKTTLEEAIETRISLDALSQELEHSKEAAATVDSTQQQRQAQAAAALAAELSEVKQSLVEAVECGEAAADALAGAFSQTHGSILTVILHMNGVPCCWHQSCGRCRRAAGKLATPVSSPSPRTEKQTATKIELPAAPTSTGTKRSTLGPYDSLGRQR